MPGEEDVRRMPASSRVWWTAPKPPSVHTPQRRIPMSSYRLRSRLSVSASSASSRVIAALSVGESGACGTKLASRPGCSRSAPPAALPPSTACRRAKPCQRRSLSVASSIPTRLLLAFEATALGLEATHPGHPALVVAAAGGHVAADLGVREDQDALLLEGPDVVVGDLLGLDDLGDLAQLVDVEAFRNHRRVDELRAQAGSADAAGAVRDVDPFRGGHGRVLGRGVAGGAELSEQAGRGCRAQEVPVAAFEHLGQQVLGGPDVRLDVDAPDEVPVVVAQVGRPALWAGDAGVGEEGVDRAVRLVRVVDQRDDLVLAADVGSYRTPVDLAGRALDALLVEVRHRHARAGLGEGEGAGAPDAARGARDHDVPARRVHSRETLQWLG